MPACSSQIAQPTLPWNVHMTWGAVLLGLFQLPFLWNLVVSVRRGAAAPANPWNATTLEWTTSSPPPPGNFDELPVVSTPPGRLRAGAGMSAHAEARAASLGMWLFLASEAMFFGALFSGYVLLRTGSEHWAGRRAAQPRRGVPSRPRCCSAPPRPWPSARARRAPRESAGGPGCGRRWCWRWPSARSSSRSTTPRCRPATSRPSTSRWPAGSRSPSCTCCTCSAAR